MGPIPVQRLMEIQREYLFDPNISNGIVFDCDIEHIFERVDDATKSEHLGSLWEAQAFAHHDHPAMFISDLEFEVELIEMWRFVLSERFPNLNFVIERRPLQQVTWYQPNVDFVVEDDPWELMIHGTQVTIDDPFQMPEKVNIHPKRDQIIDGLSHSVGIQLRDADYLKETTDFRFQFKEFEDFRLHSLHRGIFEARHVTSNRFVVLARKSIRDLIGPDHTANS